LNLRKVVVNYGRERALVRMAKECKDLIRRGEIMAYQLKHATITGEAAKSHT
jgi:hypothetical protein